MTRAAGAVEVTFLAAQAAQPAVFSENTYCAGGGGRQPEGWAEWTTQPQVCVLICSCATQRPCFVAASHHPDPTPPKSALGTLPFCQPQHTDRGKPGIGAGQCCNVGACGVDCSSACQPQAAGTTGQASVAHALNGPLVSCACHTPHSDACRPPPGVPRPLIPAPAALLSRQGQPVGRPRHLAAALHPAYHRHVVAAAVGGWRWGVRRRREATGLAVTVQTKRA